VKLALQPQDSTGMSSRPSRQGKQSRLLLTATRSLEASGGERQGGEATRNYRWAICAWRRSYGAASDKLLGHSTTYRIRGRHAVRRCRDRHQGGGRLAPTASRASSSIQSLGVVGGQRRHPWSRPWVDFACGVRPVARVLLPLFCVFVFFSLFGFAPMIQPPERRGCQDKEADSHRDHRRSRRRKLAAQNFEPSRLAASARARPPPAVCSASSFGSLKPLEVDASFLRITPCPSGKE
jgi:hypothetical protein